MIYQARNIIVPLLAMQLPRINVNSLPDTKVKMFVLKIVTYTVVEKRMQHKACSLSHYLSEGIGKSFSE